MDTLSKSAVMKLEIMFMVKVFTKIYAECQTATRTGRTPSIPNTLVTRFERVSDVRLAYVVFCIFSLKRPGARFTNTLICDCYF